VIIKNVTAAAGKKCLDMLNNAKPDGYTFGALDSSFATESLMSELEFDLNKFTYLLQFNDTTRIVVVRKDGFANWNEMMVAARAKELKWGIAQFGRATHVDSIIIREAFGIPARLIPFGGTAGMMAALIRGDVQMATGSDDSAKPLIVSGEIRVLADFTAKGGYPGVPTSADLGRPDLIEKVSGHRFFIGPPNMPKRISNIMIAAFKKSLQDPAFLAWAKRIDLQVNPIYGDEADKMAKRIFKYYTVEMKPLLTKYLVQS
jgi:tripartite-type tricarboxylate transporter receptor subunit TctC